MNQRILSAVMFTDIVGYSALASRNEEQALQIIEINRNHQKPIIEKYGTYLKEMGDGVLARFSSAYDSILCAKEIQENSPEILRDKIRIGIHLGDVSENNGDIFGDGVNVASRLESKARPGKIYFSDSVYNAIKGRGDINTRYVGTFRLKNIKYPVRTYTLVTQGEAVPTPFLKSKLWKSIFPIVVAIVSTTLITELVAFQVSRYNLDPGIVDVVTLLLVFAAIGYLIFAWLKVTRIKVILVQVLNILIAIATMGFYLLNPMDIDPSALRIVNYDFDNKDNPGGENALVVLPFYNDVGAEQEYLTAGLQDGLINEIGKLGSIRIISRTSTLSYAKSEKSMRRIANELNVDMIVEGALVAIDTVMELNIKLISPFPDEKVLWSDSYPVRLNEIQKLYREVARIVALKINEVIIPKEQALLASSNTVNTAAYQSALMARYFVGYMTPEGFDKAEQYYQRALQVDSTYAPAMSGLALVWGSRKQMGFVSPREADPIMRKYIEKALLSDDANADVWAAKAALSVWTDYDLVEGEKAFQRSIALNPNISITRAGYAHLLMIANRWDEAWKQMEYALEIDPLNPLVIAFSGVLYMFEGKFLSSTKKFEEIIAIVPDHKMANAYLLQKYSRTFQHSKAIGELKKMVGRFLPDHEKLINDSFAINGFYATIRLTAERLEEQAKTTYVPASLIEILYRLIGDKEKRLEWIEEMYNQRNPGVPYLAIKTGDPIQDDPRYIGVIKKAGLW